MTDKIMWELTTEDAKVVHEALISCHYIARDEERTLETQLRTYHGDGTEPCDECKVADWGRAEAAKRAMRYGLLAESVQRLAGEEVAP